MVPQSTQLPLVSSPAAYMVDPWFMHRVVVAVPMHTYPAGQIVQDVAAVPRSVYHPLLHWTHEATPALEYQPSAQGTLVVF